MIIKGVFKIIALFAVSFVLSIVERKFLSSELWLLAFIINWAVIFGLWCWWLVIPAKR